MVSKTPRVDPREVGWLIGEKYPELFSSRNWKKSFRALLRDVNRLRAGEPLAYVIGNTVILGERILTDKRALIPRTETEYWLTDAISELKKLRRKDLRVLDLCAGGGVAGLSVLLNIPRASVVFGEKDKKAAALIRKNLKFKKISGTRFRVAESDLFSGIRGVFDAILANPPYIPSLRRRLLPAAVTRYEPSLALYGGGDGLSFIRKIFKDAPRFLRPGGLMYLEFDAPQAKKILKLATIPGSVHKDQYGRPRFFKGRAVE